MQILYQTANAESKPSDEFSLCLEAQMGFAPMNSGFADRRVRLLHHCARIGNPYILVENEILFNQTKTPPYSGGVLDICYWAIVANSWFALLLTLAWAMATLCWLAVCSRAVNWL